MHFILTKRYFWAGFFQNVTFGLKKLKQTGKNKVEVGVHSSTLSLYGNIVAMNEVRNRVGSSNTFLKYQQQSYWKKIPCGGILLAHCWNLMKQPRLPGIFLLQLLKLNIIYSLLMGTVRLNLINHLVGFIPCQICLYFSN